MKVNEMTIKIDEALNRDFLEVCSTLDVHPEKQVQALMLAFVAKHSDVLPGTGAEAERKYR